MEHEVSPETGFPECFMPGVEAGTEALKCPEESFISQSEPAVDTMGPDSDSRRGK